MRDARSEFWTTSKPPVGQRRRDGCRSPHCRSLKHVHVGGPWGWPTTRGLWDGKGYPMPLHLGALEGSVIHQSLETILHALLDARCRSACGPVRG